MGHFGGGLALQVVGRMLAKGGAKTLKYGPAVG